MSMQRKFSLGADYSMSKRTTLGVVYTTDKSDGSSRTNSWGVQARHSF
jgi:predicted porin